MGAEVATDTAGPTPASVTLRFGMRSTTTLAPGGYTAPILFSIVAPNM